MRDVAIVGAGDLGGAIAFAVARRGGADRIRLVDAAGQIAAGKALDIMQAAPIERFAARVTGNTDPIAAAGAAIIVIADRAAHESPGKSARAESRVDEGLEQLQLLMRLSPGAVVICAGAGQREVVERGVRELGLPRHRLFGSAPEAMAASIRALVALEANGSPADVAVTVLGVPPARLVVPWDDATIGGLAATRVLDEPARRRVAARVERLWPPGPQALAAAAAAAIESLAGRSRRRLVAFVGPDDSSGRRTRAAAMPVRLGPAGIEEVIVPTLTVRDRVALDTAVQL
jgi:malate dehydrogenase